MFSVKAAAKELGISESKCYELCQKHKLAHYRIEGSIRISRQQIDEYLEKCRVGAGEAPVPRRVKLKHRRG